MAERVDDIYQDEKKAKLLTEILKGGIPEIKPQIDFQSKLGFSFPAVKQIMGNADE